jgi:hypothetical protein
MTGDLRWALGSYTFLDVIEGPYVRPERPQQACNPAPIVCGPCSAAFGGNGVCRGLFFPVLTERTGEIAHSYEDFVGGCSSQMCHCFFADLDPNFA